MSNATTEEEFLRLCQGKDDDMAVRNALETHPELAECRDTRTYWEGFTPLHHASVYDHEKVARVLLEHDAEVNARDSEGGIPLYHACVNGHDQVALLLLEHGAEVNARNMYHWTCMFMAISRNHGQVVRVLLEHGADVNESYTKGISPLQLASQDGHEEVVRLLLEHGAEVNAQSDGGWTPLHVASDEGHAGTVRILLEHGADRSVKTNCGKTARDSAESCGRTEVMDLLDTYVPVRQQMVQVLIGLRGVTGSPLTRFAAHDLFEPRVLSLVKCLLTGERNAALEQLQGEADE